MTDEANSERGASQPGSETTLLRRAVDRSPVVMFRLRPEDVTPTWVSSNFERVTGHPRESFLGSSDYWRRQLHPGDRERVLRAFREAERDEAEYVEEEFRFQDPDGDYRWYRGMAYPGTTDGEVSHFFGYVGDITSRKRFEERLREERRRLREAQAMAEVGNWEWYPDEESVYWSEEEFRIFGYEPGDVEPGYRAFRRRVHPEIGTRSIG